MKLGRNEKCHCGSGLKYKKCCLNKDSKIIEKPKITISSTLKILKTGLENLDLLGEFKENIHVKEIKIMNNDSLVCEFYPSSHTSEAIKIEIVKIMVFFNSFLKESLNEGIDYRYFAARAYDQNDRELLYALSSKESVSQITLENSIDWMKSTIFQENTDDYRLGIAKKIISEIEISLRHIIKDVLIKKFGSNWWDLSINNKLGKRVKDMYENKYGITISDGNILIDYTYILQLKKIITTHWPLFKGLFNKKIDFEISIDELNKIRREEAHNRVITESHITTLNKIYNSLLIEVAENYSDLLPSYLIDQWKSNIKSIMVNSYKPIYSETELIDEPDATLKLIKSTSSTIHLINYLEDTVIKLRSLTVPIQKRKIHNELLEQFVNYKILMDQKLQNIKNGQWDMLLETLKEIKEYEVQMNNFSRKFLLSEA